MPQPFQVLLMTKLDFHISPLKKSYNIYTRARFQVHLYCKEKGVLGRCIVQR